MIRGKERFLTQVYAVVDFIFIQLAFFVAWLFRFQLVDGKSNAHLPFTEYIFWGLIYSLINILVGFVTTLYAPKRKLKFAFEAAKILQTHLFSMFILLSVLFTAKIVDISRVFLIFYFVSGFTFTIFYRYMLKQSLRRIRSKGFNKQFILVLGAGSLGNKYYNNLLKHPEYGLEVIGFLDDFRKEHDHQDDISKPILGKVLDLYRILSNKIVDEVVVALPLKAFPMYQQIIAICEKAGVRVSIIPDFYDILPASPHFESFGDLPMINVRDVPLDEYVNRILKRSFDIIFSLAAIVITMPLMIVIAIGIKFTSPGPIIFKQERVGLNRRMFYMYKFRSMKHVPEVSSSTKWTVENDPRRTRIGVFLRKSNLDELLQFFNVLKGDMSVVGPRPERPFFVDQFKEDVPQYMIKHHVRPGITGWAQVCGYRGDTSIKNRIEHDIFYIENWTLLFDVKIIFKTIFSVRVNKNAY